MTCIAATSAQGKVWIAGDSLLTDDGPAMRARDPKVWQAREGLCVGACGDWGWVQALKRADWPSSPEDIPSRIYTSDEGAAIIGWGAKLYYLSSSKEMVAYTERIAAIGSGALVAIGALASSQACGERLVREAVKIAARYCPGEVGGRVHVVHS